MATLEHAIAQAASASAGELAGSRNGDAAARREQTGDMQDNACIIRLAGSPERHRARLRNHRDAVAPLDA